MENINKKEYFEAFLEELLKWYKETKKSDNNDLSKLKVLKLLFLWVSKDQELLNIFDNFVSWELWPIEKDIYDDLGNLNNFIVSNEKTTIKDSWYIKIDEKNKAIWKKIIESLKKHNIDLIIYSVSRLVDITHKWNCWNITQSFKITNIPTNLILSEKWYFS